MIVAATESTLYILVYGTSTKEKHLIYLPINVAGWGVTAFARHSHLKFVEFLQWNVRKFQLEAQVLLLKFYLELLHFQS